MYHFCFHRSSVTGEALDERSRRLTWTETATSAYRRFRKILANMNIHIGEEDFYYIISEVDQNMDGNISYDEFLAQLMPTWAPNEQF